MASLFISSSFSTPNQPQKIQSFPKSHSPFSLSLSKPPTKPRNLQFSRAVGEENSKDGEETSSVAVAEEDSKDNGEKTHEEREMDWNIDWNLYSIMEDFEKIMGIPSVKPWIRLQKKLADLQLKEVEAKTKSGDTEMDFYFRVARDELMREKEFLENAEEAVKTLDLNQLRSCFGFDTFFATDVRRLGDQGIFIGNLRGPIEEVIPKLEKKLSEAAGREVVLWFMEERNDDITKQVCLVQPKAEIDLWFGYTKLSTPCGYVSALALGLATFGTIALTSGSFVKPDVTFNDLANVMPFFGGFLTILGVSEIATRLTANRYGVKLSPSFLVPSNWTGCLGVMNDYESILPNKKALFDIPVARTASAYLTSLALAVTAFVSNGSFNGGDNALFISPQFFENNPLFSFIQYVIGPYADDLGNVLPYAVEGVGVPVDPLAFAGLLGMLVTSLNLLPCGRLEGGRIAQAMLGRDTAALLYSATILLLAVGALRGNVLCLAWGLFAIIFRGDVETPAKDEITPLGDDRYNWGVVLFLICFLTLYPYGGGTYSSSFFGAQYFRGDL